MHGSHLLLAGSVYHLGTGKGGIEGFSRASRGAMQGIPDGLCCSSSTCSPRDFFFLPFLHSPISAFAVLNAPPGSEQNTIVLAQWV